MNHINPNMIKHVLQGIEDGERVVFMSEENQLREQTLVESARQKLVDEFTESRKRNLPFVSNAYLKSSAIAYYEGWLAAYRTTSS